MTSFGRWLAAFGVLVLVAPCMGETWYVSKSGKNTTGLSERTAFTNLLTALNHASEGDDIQVAAGLYTGPSNVNITFSDVTILGQNDGPVVFSGRESSLWILSGTTLVSNIQFVNLDMSGACVTAGGTTTLTSLSFLAGAIGFELSKESVDVTATTVSCLEGVETCFSYIKEVGDSSALRRLTLTQSQFYGSKYAINVNVTGSIDLPVIWESFILTNMTTSLSTEDGDFFTSAPITVAVNPAPLNTVWNDVTMADVAQSVLHPITLDYTVMTGEVSVSLNGISIKNAHAYGVSCYIETIGDATAKLEVVDSSVEQVDGYAFYFYIRGEGCNILVSRCLMVASDTPLYINTYSTVNATLSESLVLDCNATYGDYFQIVDSAFVNCRETCITGWGDYNVHGCLFLGSYFAGTWTNEFARPSITSSIFVGCKRGALTNYLGSYDVDRCFFWGNGEGTINCESSLTVSDSIFFANSQPSGGGGAIVAGDVTIEGSLFLWNSASTTGGAVCVVRNAYGLADGTITNSAFLGNTAEEGSAYACCSEESTIDAENVFLGPQQTTSCPFEDAFGLTLSDSPNVVTHTLELLQEEFDVMGTTRFDSWTADDLINGSVRVDEMRPTVDDVVHLLRGHLVRLPAFDAEDIVQIYLDTVE